MVTVANDGFRYSLVYPSDLLDNYAKGAETTKARWGADQALFLYYYQLYRKDVIFGFITTYEQTGDSAETAQQLREVVRSFRSL